MTEFLPDSVAEARLHRVISAAHLQPPGDRVTPIIQWLFQRSPWVMWGGVVVALAIAIGLARWFWPRRRQIGSWLLTRSTLVKLGLIGVAALAVGLAGGTGYESYHFVQTDKRFCNGCHIFVPSGQPLIRPDTGFYTVVPKLEGKHDTIGCHTCHVLKPMKEAVKLLFWMSGIRGKDIPPHAKVPRKICESCHVQGAAKRTWQAIAATAGHRTHLESDSSALKGKVECLTCHAQTAHRFLPADSTCVREGCHVTADTRIVLGKMKGQTDLHCTLCHRFTTPVPALATRDSAAGTLRPSLKQCLSCHQMERLVPSFSPAADPHRGTCGMCHNPHTQTRKVDARTACSTAGCHGDWRKVPFHVGAAHGRRAEQCTTCHQPHAARVDASDCVGCHNSVRARSNGVLKPPLPFDTLKALRRSDPSRGALAPFPSGLILGVGGPFELGPSQPDERPGWAGAARPDLPNVPSDTFPHSRHRQLACLTCHLGRTGAKLTFVPPRGCQICHHQSGDPGDCASCHRPAALAPAVAVELAIAPAGRSSRLRSVTFSHDKHAKLRCTGCHSESVTRRPADSVTSCRGCHEQHHAPERDCSACHRTSTILVSHARPVRAHVGCNACHATPAIAGLSPTRSFCLTCHGANVDHHRDEECSTCHFQASPTEYRPRLLRPAKVE